MKYKLYPFYWRGKKYNNRNDCAELFGALYNDYYITFKIGDGSIYVSDGLYVYPDGTTYDDEEEEDYEK